LLSFEIGLLSSFKYFSDRSFFAQPSNTFDSCLLSLSFLFTG